MRKFILGLMLFVCACAQKDTVFIGQEFVGLPYAESPLGEGFAPDADPLIRTDAFDCVTFVETILANSDVEKLNQIRYKNAKVDFLERNHFVETDWLQNNADIVKNVSANYGKTAIRSVQIDKKNWLQKVHNIDANFIPVNVKLEYLPYSELKQINNEKELVVLFVADNPKMRDKIGTDLAIMHMGFLLPNGVLRHASSERGCVVDVDFWEYAQQRAQSKVNIGIILLEILQ